MPVGHYPFHSPAWRHLILSLWSVTCMGGWSFIGISSRTIAKYIFDESEWKVVSVDFGFVKAIKVFADGSPPDVEYVNNLLLDTLSVIFSCGSKSKI
eukprot:CCRYP_015461-RA/>CCRYP_015461-RA protein AED:0.34 eAED:0.60 QI:0/0/0/1/0/0/2/0/96